MMGPTHDLLMGPGGPPVGGVAGGGRGRSPPPAADPEDGCPWSRKPPGAGGDVKGRLLFLFSREIVFCLF